MNGLISACGLLCDRCSFYNTSCEGCYTVKGSAFWARSIMPDKTCPLYRCSVIERRYHGCSECGELPCKKFYDLKDPNISEEEHRKSIEERATRLREVQ